jgi:uncharacterized protein YdeI (YjbR/CyaY-like superfamily)
MLRFNTTIKRFAKQGEKTGWSYILLMEEHLIALKRTTRTAFRISGKIDNHPIEKLAAMSMGDGTFIVSINATIRKAIKKQAGAEVELKIAVDNEPIKLDEEFMDCLQDEPKALDYFNTLNTGHKNYFSKWIESAKTEPTKAKRIAMAVNALQKSWGFPEMLRANKKENEDLGLH